METFHELPEPPVRRDNRFNAGHFSYDHGIYPVRESFGRCRHGGRSGFCQNPVEYILRYSYDGANGRPVRQAHRACRDHAVVFARRNGIPAPV